MKLRLGGVIAATLALAVGSNVRAEDPPYDPAFDVQLFEYAIGPRTFLTVNNTEQATQGGLVFDFLVTFLTDPFTVYNVKPMDDVIVDSRTEVVSSLLAGDISAAYGLTSKLQLGASLPVIFSMSGDGLMPATGTPDPGGLQASGLGDLRLELKSQLWRKERMAVAGTVGVTVPSSFGTEGGSYLGDDLPSLRGRVAGQWTNADGKLSVGANVGFIGRKPREVYASEIGQQLTYGLAGSLRVTDRFSIIGETFGRSGIASFDVDESPLELAGAVRVGVTPAIKVLVGGGAGVVRGIGSPGLRMFVSVGWAPDYRDDDGDGVSNSDDRCPLVPEDFDEFEDGDGCPELDNDGDRREDAEDRCPNVSEDIDGFEDDDGCPDTDNDGDGFADLDDRCPMEKEDGAAPYPTDGCPASRRDSDGDNVSDAEDKCPEDLEDVDDFEDWDGCPEADNDGDGLADDVDQCPMCAEDLDGFEDGDGCPDLDNDDDRIPDSEDKCPLEAESYNGKDDTDGCPEGGSGPGATMDGDKVSFSEELKFERSGALRKNSKWLVLDAARAMKRERDVTKWLVVSAAKTEEIARAQADAVTTLLIAAGVNAEFLEVLARGGGATQFGVVARERSDEAAAQQPMTCPAGTEVTPRAKPISAAPAVVPVKAKAPAAAEPAKAEPAKAEPAKAEPAKAEPAKAEPAATAETPAAPVDAKPAAEPAVAAGGLPEALAKLQDSSAGISFKRDKAAFAGGATKALDRLAVLLTENVAVTVVITTHTDGRKGPDTAKTITTEQAEAAKAYLVGKGVAAERITAIGKGMDDPIGDNGSSAGREKNRRVIVTFAAP